MRRAGRSGRSGREACWSLKADSTYHINNCHFLAVGPCPSGQAKIRRVGSAGVCPVSVISIVSTPYSVLVGITIEEPGSSSLRRGSVARTRPVSNVQDMPCHSSGSSVTPYVAKYTGVGPSSVHAFADQPVSRYVECSVCVTNFGHLHAESYQSVCGTRGRWTTELGCQQHY